MIPFTGDSFLNAGGGNFASLREDDDREDVDRLEAEADVGFRRRGGGESGCMWIMLPRLPELFELLKLAAGLGRSRGGGVSPPSGWLGSIPKVDSMPIERADCGEETKGDWLRMDRKLVSKGARLPEVVRGRYPGFCCWSKNERVEPVSTLSENMILSENVLEKIVDAETMESVHEAFLCGDPRPKPNSSNVGGRGGVGSLGELSSAGLVRLEGIEDTSDSSFSSISSSLSI